MLQLCRLLLLIYLQKYDAMCSSLSGLIFLLAQGACCDVLIRIITLVYV